MIAYCPSCGMDVNIFLKKGAATQVWVCSRCHLPLRQPLSQDTTSHPDYPWHESINVDNVDENEAEDFVVESISAEQLFSVKIKNRTASSNNNEPTFAPSLPFRPMFSQVVVAEDTVLLAEIIKDSLLESRIAGDVRCCKDGEALLEAFATIHSEKRHVDLAIVDVEMPVLNGFSAVIAMRAIERGLRLRLSPVVFFSAHACDSAFLKVLHHCQPARYLNKGADGSPPRIATRLVHVLLSLKKLRLKK
jgi:CheY-like chemotaxis protein